MKYFIFFLLLFFADFIYPNKSLSQPSLNPSILHKKYTTPIYSKHWFGRLPFKEEGNSLLIHDLFIVSFSLEKKFPDWIAYQLSPSLVWGDIKAERKYTLDPLLKPGQSLNFKDYKGASHCDGKKKGYDKGHLAPLGSFKASPFIYQAQYLSNIVPQKRNLNQGPWKRLEEKVRDFVKTGHEVRILTGPLYGKEEQDKTPPCWKAVQGKIAEIPSSYWKMIAFKQKEKLKICGIRMSQNIRNQKDHPKKYEVNWKQIEQETGLKLFINGK